MKTIVKSVLWQTFHLATGQQSVPLRVLTGPAKGVVLNLDVRTQGSYWLGNYDEYAITRVPFSRYLRPGDNAWDCGAFVGFYAAIFRKLVGKTGKVIAFEASAANHDRLVRMPALNNWGNVEIRRAAVGPAHTHIEFAGMRGGSSGPANLSPRFESTTGEETEVVECFGVDQLAFEAGASLPQLIKFDLEGAEQQALHNGSRVFQELRPVVLLELHGARAVEATASFMDIYHYVGAPVHLLGQFTRASEEQWLATFHTHAFYNGAAFASAKEAPHMMLMLPGEHPDLKT